MIRAAACGTQCMQMIILSVAEVIAMQMQLHLHILQKHSDTKTFMYVKIPQERIILHMAGVRSMVWYMIRSLQRQKVSAEITELLTEYIHCQQYTVKR